MKSGKSNFGSSLFEETNELRQVLHLFIYLFIYLSIYLSIYLFIYLFIYIAKFFELFLIRLNFDAVSQRVGEMRREKKAK